jgi:hypothetical protein
MIAPVNPHTNRVVAGNSTCVRPGTGTRSSTALCRALPLRQELPAWGASGDRTGQAGDVGGASPRSLPGNTRLSSGLRSTPRAQCDGCAGGGCPRVTRRLNSPNHDNLRENMRAQQTRQTTRVTSRKSVLKRANAGSALLIEEVLTHCRGPG